MRELRLREIKWTRYVSCNEHKGFQLWSNGLHLCGKTSEANCVSSTILWPDRALYIDSVGKFAFVLLFKIDSMISFRPSPSVDLQSRIKANLHGWFKMDFWLPHQSQVYSALTCRQLAFLWLLWDVNYWSTEVTFCTVSSLLYSHPTSLVWNSQRTQNLSESKWTRCNFSLKETSLK